MAFQPFKFLEEELGKYFEPIGRRVSSVQQTMGKLQQKLQEYQSAFLLKELLEDTTASMYFTPIEAHKNLKEKIVPLAERLTKATDKYVKKMAESIKNVIGAYISKMKEIADQMIEREQAGIYQEEKKIREASQKIGEKRERISKLLAYNFD